MAYENADYINQLNQNLPQATDTISEGDIHLRLLKEVLKQSFPNVDMPVNAIHTSPTEPPLFSAGTVWFDTSTGLIKMRNMNNTKWMVMAHGEAGGLGSILKMGWQTWSGISLRNNSMQLVKDFTITPLSPTSTFIFSMTGFATAWGYGAHQTVYVQFKDDTSGVDISAEHPIVGFQHVDDSGNFEIKCAFSTKDRYPNHPAGPFELGLYARCADGSGGGYQLEDITIEVIEVE